LRHPFHRPAGGRLPNQGDLRRAYDARLLPGPGEPRDPGGAAGDGRPLDPDGRGGDPALRRCRGRGRGRAAAAVEGQGGRPRGGSAEHGRQGGRPPLERRLKTFAHEEVLTSCDACGGIELHTVDARAHVMECGGCGYRFVNPRPTQAAIAAAYSDPHAYDHWLEEEEGRDRMWRKRLDLLERAGGGTRGRLLDVGAGIGTFLALARERGWEVAGTEVSQSAIRLARKRHSLELIPGQLQEARLPAGSFEVVTLWHVLEHVPSPSSALRTANSLLS